VNIREPFARRVLALALPCACLAPAFGQDDLLRPTQKTELWTSMQVQWRPFRNTKRIAEPQFYRRFRAAAEVGYRSDDAFFAGRQIYFDIMGRYRINKHWRVGFDHRYGLRPGREDRQRSLVQVAYRQKWKRFQFDYRLRYQHAYRPPGRVRSFARNRLMVSYNIRRWKLDPEVSMETFTWVGYKGNIYRGARYSVGTDWSPWKGHSIAYKLVHDRETGVKWPEFRWIHSISWSINLDRI